jgi:hypothetical protein
MLRACLVDQFADVVGDVVERLANDLGDLRRGERAFVQDDEDVNPRPMSHRVGDHFLDALFPLP